MRLTKNALRSAGLLLIVVLAWWLAPTGGAVEGGTSTVLDAFESRRSGVVVELTGRVVRTLTDDNQGSRHQRFVLDIGEEHTVLVSHNIDLAERVPVEQGEHLELRGQYEWNAQGGVIHWTHHDPQGQREGGWIEHEGQVYR